MDRSPTFLLRKLAYLIQREERLTRDLEAILRAVDETVEEIDAVLGPESEWNRTSLDDALT